MDFFSNQRTQSKVCRVLGLRFLFILVTTGMLFLGGCTFRKTFYNNLDFFLVYQADKYFDLDSDHRSMVRGKLLPLLSWHRTVELPRYENFIVSEKRALTWPLEKSHVERLVGDVNGAWRVIAERALPDAAHLLSQLEPDQVQNYLDVTKKSINKQLADLEGDASRYYNRRFSSLEKNVKTWMGSFGTSEEAAVDSYLKVVMPFEKTRLQERAARNQVFAKLLEGKSQSEIKKFLEEWWLSSETFRSTVAKEQHSKRQAALVDLIVSLSTTATEKQKRHFLSELESLQSDLRVLAQRNR